MEAGQVPSPRDPRLGRRELLTGALSAVAGAAVAVPAAAHGGVDHATRAEHHRRSRASVAAGPADRLGTARVIWSVPGATRSVSLTFDDGPDPDFTPRVLTALAHAGARASFNVMGWAALQHPGLLTRIVAEGHEIGNHTWTHEDFASLDPGRTREQLVRGRDAIEQVTRVPLRFLRPPRGDLSGSALRLAAELGYDVLLWSVTRGNEPGAGTVEGVTAAVTDDLRPGDIVGLHDGIGRGTFAPGSGFGRALIARREVEVRALPGILRRIADAGLAVVTAGELVAAGGSDR